MNMFCLRGGEYPDKSQNWSIFRHGIRYLLSWYNGDVERREVEWNKRKDRQFFVFFQNCVDREIVFTLKQAAVRLHNATPGTCFYGTACYISTCYLSIACYFVFACQIIYIACYFVLPVKFILLVFCICPLSIAC